MSEVGQVPAIPERTGGSEKEPDETIVDDRSILGYVRACLAPTLYGSYRDEKGALVIEAHTLKDLTDVWGTLGARSVLDMSERADLAYLYLNPTHLRYGVRPGEVFLQVWRTTTGPPIGYHQSKSWSPLGLLGKINLMKQNEWGGWKPTMVSASALLTVLKNVPLVTTFEGTLENVPLRGMVKDWWNRFSYGYFSVDLRWTTKDACDPKRLEEVKKLLQSVDVGRLSE